VDHVEREKYFKGLNKHMGNKNKTKMDKKYQRNKKNNDESI